MIAIMTMNTNTDITNGGRSGLHRLSLGKAIITLRRERGLSQEALALKADIDRSYMGRIERGERSVSFDKIDAICHALGIDFLELFHAELVERRLLQRDGSRTDD